MATTSEEARRLAVAASDEDYFPAFLTAAPSAPKAKAKPSAPANTRAKRYADGGAFRSKPRLRMTFAESLAMDKKRERLPSQDDSPFALGGADAIDRTYVRKRKPFNPGEDAQPQGEDGAELDDAPPPPTTTLLGNPSGFLSAKAAADAEENTVTFPKRSVSAAAASFASAGLFPSAGDAQWGSDGQFWITVFGFPASARAFVLSHFQTVGEVANFSSGGGNWLRLRYRTRLQAEKALSFDGQTIGGGSVMIGVKKCYPSELDGAREEPASNLFASRARQNPGSSELEVDPTEPEIMLPPRRRPDICSRLLGYLFNW